MKSNKCGQILNSCAFLPFFLAFIIDLSLCTYKTFQLAGEYILNLNVQIFEGFLITVVQCAYLYELTESIKYDNIYFKYKCKVKTLISVV